MRYNKWLKPHSYQSFKMFFKLFRLDPFDIFFSLKPLKQVVIDLKFNILKIKLSDYLKPIQDSVFFFISLFLISIQLNPT